MGFAIFGIKSFRLQRCASGVAHTGAARASVATSAAQSGVCARAPGGADRSQPGRALTTPHAGRPATMFAIIALDTVPRSIYKKVSHFYVTMHGKSQEDQSYGLFLNTWFHACMLRQYHLDWNSNRQSRLNTVLIELGNSTTFRYREHIVGYRIAFAYRHNL